LDYEITELPKFSDERGYLVEYLKAGELEDSMKSFGQIYLSTIAPGHTRGNHFHRHKHEFFGLMTGKVTLVVEDVDTGRREEHELDSGGDHIYRVRVGPGVAHAITNTSDELVVLCSYTDKEYDRDNLDQEAYALT